MPNSAKIIGANSTLRAEKVLKMAPGSALEMSSLDGKSDFQEASVLEKTAAEERRPEDPAPRETCFLSLERLNEEVDNLARESRLALDLESDSFHRYYEKVCLVQLSSPSTDYIFDPLESEGMPQKLRKLLEDPERTWVLHSADNDVRALKRDFDLRVGRLFDTAVAASFLGFKGLGLKTLLETELGVCIDKSEQRSDWGKRPLTATQIKYALADTRDLLALAEVLEEKLHQRGRHTWFEEECALLRLREPAPRVFDPEGWRKIKGSKQLGVRGQKALRASYLWRENVAESKNLPPFKVVRSEQLVRLGALIDKEGASVLNRLKRLRFLPRNLEHAGIAKALRESFMWGDEVVRKPPRNPKPPPNPQIRKKVEVLRAQRVEWAKKLELDPGFLVSGAVLLRIATERPQNLCDLGSVEGMTQWRVEALGAEILKVLSL